jgi:dolichol-phosphate mannosyltransferase
MKDAPSATRKALIIVPTYNEEENIDLLVDGIFSNAPDVHVLFVDDNSRDKTQQKIEERQKSRPAQIFLLCRPGKMGLGTAYLTGFDWALKKGYDCVIEMDADLSHDPTYLPTMLSKLQNFDVVIGSRYTAGGGTKNWHFMRRCISRFGSFYGRLVLGVSIKDLTGGFNGWSRHALQTIDLKSIRSEGYAFQIELKYAAFRANLPITEIPIVFVDRRVGYSKMSYRIVLEAMLMVPSLRSRHRR